MINISTNLVDVLDNHFDERMKNVYTAIPAHVVAFDPKTQLAQVQIGIMRMNVDGTTTKQPVILDCPVFQFGGTEWTMEMQIDVGCEGLAVFSQRCVDGWLNTGGAAVNPLRRFHDMQDCFFIPGFRPIPTAIKDFKQDGIRVRNNKGDQYVWLKNDKSIELNNSSGSIVIEPSGNVKINKLVTIDTAGNISTEGTITAKGTMTTQGSVNATGDVVGGGVSLKSHTHSGVESGGSNTGVPN